MEFANVTHIIEKLIKAQDISKSNATSLRVLLVDAAIINL